MQPFLLSQRARNTSAVSHLNLLIPAFSQRTSTASESLDLLEAGLRLLPLCLPIGYCAITRNLNCDKAPGSVGELDLASSGSFPAWLPRRAGSCIDDKTNVACFSSLGVVRDRPCHAKKRSLSHPTTEFSERAQLFKWA